MKNQAPSTRDSDHVTDGNSGVGDSVSSSHSFGLPDTLDARIHAINRHSEIGNSLQISYDYMAVSSVQRSTNQMIH